MTSMLTGVVYTGQLFAAYDMFGWGSAKALRCQESTDLSHFLRLGESISDGIEYWSWAQA